MDEQFALASPEAHLVMKDANVVFYPQAFTAREASKTFLFLHSECAWRNEKVFIWGKWHNQPRLVAWYGDAGTTYKYSGVKLQPLAWTPFLQGLKTKMELLSGARFNSVLLNLYRDQRDHVSWHSDDELQLGSDPTIVSLSVGATRVFQFKRKDKSGVLTSLPVTSGSVLVMRGSTQRYWSHRIRKETKPHGARINLTFRFIKRKDGEVF